MIPNLAVQLVSLAAQKNIFISAAESCTGGALSASITAVPGASQIFLGSVVSYSNSAKVDLLHVSPNVISEAGEVSAIAAEQMLQGALTLFKSHLAVAITGYAGPDGGNLQYPIGTVFVAFGWQNDRPITFQLNYTGGRLAIIEQVVVFVLKQLIEWCKKVNH